MNETRLFILNGESIKFSLKHCVEKKEIRKLITENGGTMVKKETVDTIVLSPPGDKQVNDKCITVKFIYDCIKAKKLLDFTKYRVKGNFSESSDDVSENSDFEHECDIFKKLRNSPKKYTLNEDRKIINYLSRNERFRKWKGRKMWQDFETVLNKKRTWQSLKNRFGRTIRPNIRSYNVSKKMSEYLQSESESKSGSSYEDYNEFNPNKPRTKRTEITKSKIKKKNSKSNSEKNVTILHYSKNSNSTPQIPICTKMFSSDESDLDNLDENVIGESNLDHLDENAIVTFYDKLPHNPLMCNEDHDNYIIQILQHILGINEIQILKLLVQFNFNLPNLFQSLV